MLCVVLLPTELPGDVREPTLGTRKRTVYNPMLRQHIALFEVHVTHCTRFPMAQVLLLSPFAYSSCPGTEYVWNS